MGEEFSGLIQAVAARKLGFGISQRLSIGNFVDVAHLPEKSFEDISDPGGGSRFLFGLSKIGGPDKVGP